jgi:DNA-binding MarR family transcriptional regulator
MVIDVNPGINVGALAAMLSKDQASTSIVVDKLMGLGLLTRETDPEDRRRARLSLTPLAKPIVEHIESARDDINRLVFDALGSERAQQLEALLKELLEAIEGGEGSTRAAHHALGGSR